MDNDRAEKEKQLFEDLKEGNDGDFATHFAQVAWGDRAQVAKDLRDQLDANRPGHPELPNLILHSGLKDTPQEFVRSLDVIEERSKWNPKRWFGSNRTAQYEVYSPNWLERAAHGIGRGMGAE